MKKVLFTLSLLTIALFGFNNANAQAVESGANIEFEKEI